MTDNPGTACAAAGPPLTVDHLTVYLFRKAHSDADWRLYEARHAGDEEEVRRLEEEAEVLHWKTLVAMKPDREVTAALVEKFDEYEDHPRLPADCRAMLDLCPA